MGPCVDTTEAALLVALALLVAVHVAAERRATRWQWASKAAASACFVALGIIAHASAWMMLALALAAVGDVLLVPKDPVVFRVGILAFLGAHVAFSAEFWTRGVSLAWAGGTLVLFAVLAVLVGQRILAAVPPMLKRAVLAYMAVITAMVALAAGAAAGPAGPRWLAAPALAFWANDLLVARHRFLEPAFWHRAVGLPLYYGAMAAFALSGAASS
jgi:uncharacterized membrane protein YhhN